MKMNRERLLEQFLELVKIDSETGNEQAMLEYLQNHLSAMGLELQTLEAEDGSLKVPNLYATLPGDESLPTLLFNAHMDTVQPGKNKRAKLEPGVIKSEGDTILAADDFAGIAIILEMLAVVKESQMKHGTLRFLFTVGEEAGLLGSRAIAKGAIQADYAFVLDDAGTAGTYTCSAPAHDKFEITIHGKAAHAGVEPEAGVSSVSILANALTLCPIGRVDEETTYNIGIIHGGQAMNVVCPELKVTGEARSNKLDKLDRQTAAVEKAFNDAAEGFGGKITMKTTRLYHPISIQADSAIAQRLQRAADICGLSLNPVVCGGGTDASVLVAHGIPAVTLAIGYYKMHSVDEYLDLKEFYKSADFAFALLQDTER